MPTTTPTNPWAVQLLPLLISFDMIPVLLGGTRSMLIILQDPFIVSYLEPVQELTLILFLLLLGTFILSVPGLWLLKTWGWWLAVAYVILKSALGLLVVKYYPGPFIQLVAVSFTIPAFLILLLFRPSLRHQFQ